MRASATLLPTAVVLGLAACQHPVLPPAAEPSAFAPLIEPTSASAATPAPLPTAAPSATVTQRPGRPTQQVYPTLVIADFPEELAFHTPQGGGDGGFCEFAKDNDGNIAPGITGEIWPGDDYNMGNLCVSGIQIEPGAPVTITLYGPDGTYTNTFRWLVEDGRTRTEWERGGQSEPEVRVSEDGFTFRPWQPAGLGTGIWTARIESGSQVVEGTFPVYDPPSPTVSTTPALPIDPLLWNRCAVYQPGETVYITGDGFEANAPAEAALYRLPDQAEGARGILAQRVALTADAQGHIRYAVLIGSSWPDSFYRIVFLDDIRQPSQLYAGPEPWGPLGGACFWVAQ